MKSNLAIARVLKEKGAVYFKKYKDYDKAEDYFKKSYEIIKSSSKSSTKRAALNGLVDILIHKGDYKNAKKYLTLYEDAVKGKNSLHSTSMLYKSYSKYYEKTGQPVLAMKYFKDHHKIEDSISNKEITTKVINLEKKYDIKNKELKIISLNQEKDAQEKLTQEANFKRKLYLIAVTILALLLLFGIWIYSKLKKQKKALTIANTKLAETNTIKNRLFSIIAHDLRSMLIPFQRTGKIVKYHIDNENQERAIAIAQELENNSQSLSNMLDNLLSWSLDQMNGYTYNATKIKVKTELQNIIKGFNQQAKHKNTTISLEFTEDVNILFDKGAFHVIFRNLIGNALKYTEDGNIKVMFRQEFNTIHFSVIDSGTGMDKTQLESLFKLEENNTTLGTQGEKGTGIGLNLVYRFVNLNKGSINVSSEKRIGTRFDLNFPILESLTKDSTPNLGSLSA